MIDINVAAYNAGFRKSHEMQSCNKDTKEIMGFTIVESELLPVGWFGMKTQRGAVLVGPKGQLVDVPFFPKDWPSP